MHSNVFRAAVRRSTFRPRFGVSDRVVRVLNANLLLRWPRRGSLAVLSFVQPQDKRTETR